MLRPFILVCVANASSVSLGHVLSGSSSDEGYLMSGRSEIAGFFGCPAISAKFTGSKVKVDVVHPLPNPMCLNAISLSVKGTLFLPVNTGLYESAEYSHFISLSPAPQRFANQPVTYLIATEFLHIYRKPMPIPGEIVQPAISASPSQEPPLLSHPPHMMPVAPPPPPPPPTLSTPAEQQQQQAQPPPPPPTHVVRRYNDELSLHAVAVTAAGSAETKNMTPQQIVEAVNEALKQMGISDGRCLHVMRPAAALNSTSATARTFFFLHFNRVELVEKLRKTGQLEIGDGIMIKLSPIKRKYGGQMRPNRFSSNKSQPAPASQEPVATAGGAGSAETVATLLENSSAKSGGESGRRKSLKFKKSTKI